MDKKMTGACLPRSSRIASARACHAPRSAAACVCSLAALALPPARTCSHPRNSLRRVYPPFACAVKLNGNRKVTGTLRGFDQFLNIVLDESVDGATKESMGMVVIRGNSIMLLEPLERIA